MDLIELVTTEPEVFKDYHLVKIRKDFSSKWYSIVKSTDFSILGNENILNRLVSIPKTIQYTKELPDIPIFLPIVEKYLYILPEKKVDIFLDTKYTKKENIRKDMFGTFLNFLNKKGVVFTDYDSNNNPILGKLISRILEWDRKKFSDWMTDGGLLSEKFESLPLSKKLEVISYVTNEWTTIWSDNLQSDLRAHFIYSKFSDRHTLFTTFNFLFESIKYESLPNSFFGKNLQIMVNDLNEFSDYSVEVNNAIKIYNYLKMDSTIQVPIKKSNVIKKI